MLRVAAQEQSLQGVVDPVSIRRKIQISPALTEVWALG